VHGLPVVALVGRPNVGKSTLFNRLTRSRSALVADVPGLTRDRQYGVVRGERAFTVVDTGGIDAAMPIASAVRAQVDVALDECDLALFLVDARGGVTTGDHDIARQLRERGRDVVLVVNKVDGVDVDALLGDLYGLGLGEPSLVAASHGRGVAGLLERVLERLPAAEGGEDAGERGIVVGIVGRPNVGKSTLVNRLLGEARVVVADEPGTTRDSIFIPLERDGERFTLVDTAGVRRRARVDDMVEKFSVLRTLDALAAAHVAIVLLDAHAGVGEQDLRLLGYALDAGCGVIVAVNKWDGLDAHAREQVRRELDRRLVAAPWVELTFISALHGTGVGDLLPRARDIYASGTVRFTAAELTRLLEGAITAHAPPLVRGRRIKLRYAHAGGNHPPVIVVHGNQTEHVPQAYRRYLENVYRDALGVRGTPVVIELKTGANPFRGRRNTLTPRQQRQRTRVIRHARSG
jgi:GTP-binding protein